MLTCMTFFHGSHTQRREKTFCMVCDAPDVSMMTVWGGHGGGDPVGRFSWPDRVPLAEVSLRLCVLTTGTDGIPLNTWCYWKPLLKDEDWARGEASYVCEARLVLQNARL
ncbi:MAG: hypothetical protein ACM309_06905 [Bacillota bacterium]